jgi:parallel beta-helix repeat protein
MGARLQRALVPVSVMALIGIWGSGTASAETITVQKGDSIQAAVDQASEGDTIEVAKGTYKENVEISTSGIKLVGKHATITPPKKPHKGSYCWGKEDESHSGICIAPQDFDFENFAPASGTVSGVEISGFTVKGFDGTGIVVYGGDANTITDNKLKNNQEYGVAAFVSTATTITGNTAAAKRSEAGFYVGDSPDSQALVRDNTSKGASYGFFLRSARNATFEGNTASDNCMGALVLGDSPGPAGDSTFTDNAFTKNDKFCPAGDGPATSGVGIAVASGSGVNATGNRIVDNTTNRKVDVTGGVVVLALPGPEGPGTPPANNTFTGNTITGSDPDVLYDGSGTNNTFTGNTCTSSQPEGLCTG